MKMMTHMGHENKSEAVVEGKGEKGKEMGQG